MYKQSGVHFVLSLGMGFLWSVVGIPSDSPLEKRDFSFSQQVPHLSKKLFATETCWEKELV